MARITRTAYRSTKVERECTDADPCCTAGRRANWQDTSCLDDCHYPTITASKMLRKVAAE